jgi:histidine triad (HIT) family protein
MEDCLFCKMSSGEIPVKKIYENSNFFSIFDINQEIKGHALVICKKHFDNSLSLPNSLGAELLDCTKNTALKLMKEDHADGFNVLNNNFKSAGQIVNHFHLHILPRRKDDGINLPA